MEALSARIRNALRNLSLFSNFLLHYHFALSFFIHRNPAIPTITATLHYPSPRTTPIQNPPPSAVTTIIHYSFFIIHSHSSPPTPPSPPTPHYPSPRTTPILHFSFIKAPPSPLSPSFLSAPFSHFLTASYCCRAHCSPTAYSLSFSCRPLSSPRFS